MMTQSATRKTIKVVNKNARSKQRDKASAQAKAIAKKKLQRLNWLGKPVIREFRLNGDKSDYAVMWAAYQRGAFEMQDDLTQEEFTNEINLYLRSAYNFIVIEDFSSIAGGEMAPVGFISEKFDGWMVEPHLDWFPWATKKNKLRGVVNYLRFLKQNTEYGCATIKCIKDDLSFFSKIKSYGVLHNLNQFGNGYELLDEVGKIVGGDPRGDVYLFSMMCSRALKAG